MTNAEDMIGVRTAPRRMMPSRLSRVRRSRPGLQTGGRRHLFIAVLALAGIILPQELEISLGAGARFTPGRFAAALLFLPALFTLFKKGRSLLLCDFLVFATVAWMLIATFSASGISEIPTAGGDGLDFLGGYLISRAYFCDERSLDTFVRVLKVFVIIAIAFALADNLSGRLITHDMFTAIFGAAPYQGEFRNGWVRAASTFPHPILFGIFCALTAAVLIYWETGALRRNVAVGVCFFGCVLSLSSAALMTFLMVLVFFSYNRLLRHYWWRWLVLWIAIGTFVLAVCLAAEHPLQWVLSHLTLDPQTGYWRILIWDTASGYVDQSPWVGYAYQKTGNWILDGTVDSIWLVYTLRFGIPMVILFFFATLTSFFPSRRSARRDDFHMDQMRRAFTLVLVMFIFTGLTVHFWNFMLMFWGLCLGIRASLRELRVQPRASAGRRVEPSRL